MKKSLCLIVLALLLTTLSSGESDTHCLVLRFARDSVPYSGEIIARSGAERIDNPDIRADEVLVWATDSQEERLRDEAGILYFYPASAELIAGVATTACAGNWEGPSGQVGEYVMAVGDGWTNGSRGVARLTYAMGSISPRLGRDRQLQTIQKALAEWSKYVQVEFTYTERIQGERNLTFLFASGNHGDGFPFDGPGKSLAHTFYPAGVNSEPIAGDLHFDADEAWQNAVDPDFYAVVLHEVGHALGLGHSDKPDAVMYPYYRKLEGLQTDDIAAIRTLYASRVVATPPPPSSSVDKTAPTLTISTPGTSIYSTSAATMRIAGTAKDNVGLTEISWTATGGRAGTAQGTTSWTIPNFSLRQGDNSIVIRAKDQAGNTSWRNLTVTRR